MPITTCFCGTVAEVIEIRFTDPLYVQMLHHTGQWHYTYSKPNKRLLLDRSSLFDISTYNSFRGILFETFKLLNTICRLAARSSTVVRLIILSETTLVPWR